MLSSTFQIMGRADGGEAAAEVIAHQARWTRWWATLIKKALIWPRRTSALGRRALVRG